MHSINKLIAGLPAFLLTMITFSSLAQLPDSTGIKSTQTVAVTNKEGLPVSGVIKDASSGQPLAGISISVSEYSAALTDDKGRFEIRVPDYNTTLFISGQGFQQKQVPLKGRKAISVSLFEGTYTSFYDQAVLPTGSQSQSQITYAVSSLNPQGGWNLNSETADTYLQGRVSGLNAVRRSGTPGIGADLQLRGFTSMNATNQPLIVVDGMVYDNTSYGNSLIGGHVNNPLQYLDVKDIDNISIIKDAGAALYGSKSANGVILITTARARELATKIDFAAYGGANFAPKGLPVMGADDYRIYLSDMLKSARIPDAYISSLPFMMDDPATNTDFYNYHSNTNWQKNVFKPSYDNNYYLKVTGGDNIAKYGLSMGYLKDEGIIENTDQVKYSTRFNADFNLAKKLVANANLSFTYNEQNLKPGGLSADINPIYVSLAKAPFLTSNIYDGSGNESPKLSDSDMFGMSNPQAIMDNVQDAIKGYRFFGLVNFDYTFNPTWQLGTRIGVTYDKSRENMFVPRAGIADGELWNAISDSRLGSQVMRLFSIYSDTHLSFNKRFNRIHQLSATAGLRYSHSDSEQDYALAYNSATDQLISIGNGDPALRNLGGEIGRWNWLNNYLNIGYQLSDKYFINANLALDGSSRFGQEAENGVALNGYKFAFFPSVSGAWLVSAENFMSGTNWIEMLKLRASYGLTGNDDIGNYTAKQYYVSQNLLGMQGLDRGNIANKALQWETVKKANLGIDAAFLNERLSLSLDVYRNTTDHMLTYEPTNTISGIGFYVSNNGSMETSGAELNVNARIINKVFKWDAGFNVGAYKNEVQQLPYSSLLTGYANATYITMPGESANLFYGYTTDGVFSSNAEAASAGYSIRTTAGNLIPFQGGDRKFTDVNGDKVIDESDRVVIGDPNPDFFGSISTRMSWKRWSLDGLLTFSVGNDIFNYTRYALESVSSFNNQTLQVNNRWRADGQITDVPKATWGDPMGNSRFSDQWIEDGSYLKLRTISLGYDLPLSGKKGLKYTRVYATANNLFTISRYLGYDPEFSASGSLFTRGADTALQPQYKSVQLGIRIGL